LAGFIHNSVGAYFFDHSVYKVSQESSLPLYLNNTAKSEPILIIYGVHIGNQHTKITKQRRKIKNTGFLAF